MPKKYNKIAQSLSLESFKGDLLDKLLANGWYRMGPSFFTTHYLFYGEGFYSAIWLRSVLEGYSLSKSLRKIDRKNKELFTHRVDAFTHTDELDELYQAYTASFKGELPETLSTYMMDSLDLDIYDTRLVKIYDGAKLIACSIFDVGAKTIASIFGMYHPDYHEYSLGLYTMLLEIEFCQAHKMDFYYVGYFVPGNPRFDYKLRVGHQQYFDLKTNSWIDQKLFSTAKTPMEESKLKLNELKAALCKNYKVSIYKNAYIDAHIIEFFPMAYVDFPLILWFEDLNTTEIEADILIVVYEVQSSSYKLLLCEFPFIGFSNYNPDWIDRQDAQTIKQELILKKVLKKCKTPIPILRWLDETTKNT